MKLIQAVRERITSGFKVSVSEVPSAITIEDIEAEMEDEKMDEEGREASAEEGEADDAEPIEVDEADSDLMETESPRQGKPLSNLFPFLLLASVSFRRFK